jgi:hypothetical protein
MAGRDDDSWDDEWPKPRIGGFDHQNVPVTAPDVFYEYYKGYRDKERIEAQWRQEFEERRQWQKEIALARKAVLGKK